MSNAIQRVSPTLRFVSLAAYMFETPELQPRTLQNASARLLYSGIRRGSSPSHPGYPLCRLQHDAATRYVGP